MEIQDDFNTLENKVKKQMGNLKNNSTTKTVAEFLDTFLQYGIFLSSSKSDQLPDTVILDFTIRCTKEAADACVALEDYFMNLSSKLGYVYEDRGEQECVLTEICLARSGLEFFIDFFQTRLRQIRPQFDDWYTITAGIPRFDELLREKVKRYPINARIPDDIPETHWWWQHPQEW